jgi:hypothetical protein
MLYHTVDLGINPIRFDRIHSVLALADSSQRVLTQDSQLKRKVTELNIHKIIYNMEIGF